MEITLAKLMTYDPKNLNKVLATKDKTRIVEFLDEFGLEVRNKKIEVKKEFEHMWDELHAYYDKKQLVVKIQLNSA